MRRAAGIVLRDAPQPAGERSGEPYMSKLQQLIDGRTDLVFDLLEEGTPPTATDDNGLPIIRWCAYYGDVSAIRHLLGAGAPLDSLGENLGLSAACFHGHWRLVQFLIQRGADVNHAEPETGETPLHAALCKSNRPAYDYVVQILLSAGANVNPACNVGAETGCFMRDVRTRGEQPLHRAAAFATEESIKALLAAGANKEAKDAHGDAPLSWASRHGRGAHILEHLLFGPHKLHPAQVENARRHAELGWQMMEHHLLGKPHI